MEAGIVLVRTLWPLVGSWPDQGFGIEGIKLNFIEKIFNWRRDFSGMAKIRRF